MVLAVHSNASYLSKPKALGRMGRHMFMAGRDDIPTNNGTILNISQIIRTVMSSAMEAELGALFINAKTAVSMCHMLEELGHPQPPTPMQTDNKTANDLLTNKIMPKDSRQWACVFTGYDDAMLREDSDITGDQAHRTWQIISPSITQPVTTRPVDPLS